MSSAPKAGADAPAGSRTLEDFARQVLLGGRLEDKLARLDESVWVDSAHEPLAETPAFPARPSRLARVGKADFPRDLRGATARGQVLHFFANHELLAMELMALVLLRFPEAPREFRAGIARTIGEEQAHLELYLARMRELGVDFGDLPVSDYFWSAMRGMRSPLEFVTQMSLTLEQANLDFSLHYQREIERAGDAATAMILERVYREEIGHVKHGLMWFNRWRAGRAPESDWQAYLRLLPPPMTARRARGIGFAAEARREAGLSDAFIRELEVYGGSKGRPPVFWSYNPLCDAEIARGLPGLNAPDSVGRRIRDLEPLLLFLAGEQDVVLLNEDSAPPRPEWLKSLHELGIASPEFRAVAAGSNPPREDKIAGIEPWGWSPASFERYRGWRERLLAIDGANGGWTKSMLARTSYADSRLGELFSKSWSAEYLREWLKRDPEAGAEDLAGETFQSWTAARARIEELLAAGRTALAKAPYGTSGMQNKRFIDRVELEGPRGQWLHNTLASQIAIVIEPWLDKVADLSMQIDVGVEGVRILGVRKFCVGGQLEYRGTELDPRLTSLGAEAQRFLRAGTLHRWESLARDLGARLRDQGYRGPAGIDAMLWRDSVGALRLKPLVELNPRWTFGRVALEIESHVAPGERAEWRLISRRELTRADSALGFADWWNQASLAHPVKTRIAGGGLRIAEGWVATTDPLAAQEVLTVLAVGNLACDALGAWGTGAKD